IKTSAVYRLFMSAVATPAMISAAPQNPAMNRLRRHSTASNAETALAAPASAAGRTASTPNVRKFIEFIEPSPLMKVSAMIGQPLATPRQLYRPRQPALGLPRKENRRCSSSGDASDARLRRQSRAGSRSRPEVPDDPSAASNHPDGPGGPSSQRRSPG